MTQIKTALISVSNKTGIIEFAKFLAQKNIALFSTGGTAKLLRESGLHVTDVSSVTGFPEMMDGRVKTLHPKIHGGILAVRSNKKHLQEAKANQIVFFDMVVVNLYPFEDITEDDNVALDRAIENIDIGGPSMIRSAAKNFKDVIVVTNPQKYAEILKELNDTGTISLKTKEYLAMRAFEHTAHYDVVISDFLKKQFQPHIFPKYLNISYTKVEDLRYGENPHQKAALYKESHARESCVPNAKQLHGKQLSYNNIVDLNDAFELVKDFDEPTAAIIKHTNPCGIASRKKIEDAYYEAYRADPMSAFGSVVALNRPCTLATAKHIRPLFVEAVIAPSFDAQALELLKEKKDIRLLESGPLVSSQDGYYYKRIVGGMLAQTRDFPKIAAIPLQYPTQRKPSKKETDDLFFAWKVCKHVKSNSIVFAKNKIAIGVGAGQMSRVDASIIAVRKAGERAHGSVMASDAFFPFRDGVDEAAKAGVTAIIQPGGSIRDQEVIAAANEHGIAMVFTGIRLFKH